MEEESTCDASAALSSEDFKGIHCVERSLNPNAEAKQLPHSEPFLRRGIPNVTGSYCFLASSLQVLATIIENQNISMLRSDVLCLSFLSSSRCH